MDLFLAIFTFLFAGIIKLVCSVTGVILIPIAVLFNAYGPAKSVDNKDILLFTWKIMRPYNNLEDGIVAGNELLDKPQWMRIIYWSAKRNPANGLRYLNLIAPLPDSSKVKYISSFGSDQDDIGYENAYHNEEQGEFWYLAWQGPYANFRWEFKLGKEYYRVWIGYKIYPSSQYKIPNYQRHGIGMTGQIFSKVTRHKI